MKSLQARLIAMATAVLLTSGLAAGLGGYHAAQTEADEILDSQLAQVAQTLVFLLQADEFDSVGDIGQSSQPDHSLMVYQVWRLKPAHAAIGSIAWSRRPPSAIETYPRLVLRASPTPWPANTLAQPGYRSIALSGRRFRFLSMTSNNGEYRVEIGQDLIDREEMVRQIAWNNTWPYLLILPLGTLVLIWSMHRGLAPLRRLATELASRDPSHLDHLSVAGLPSELQPVLGSLNTLLERLKSALENERRFTGDAAHELRTPMAALRAQLDAMRLATDKEHRAQAQRQAAASLDRMVRLVNQLLTLARLDAAQPPDRTPANAVDIAREVCQDMAAPTLAKAIDLALHADAEPLLRCDPDDLRILLRNLIDNATRYSDRGGRIDVRIGRTQGRTELTVADDGPGIPAHRMAELGRRFHRLGNQTPGGSGLGLSIVLRIAERYGADVAFRPGLANRGLAVTIRFPEAA